MTKQEQPFESIKQQNNERSKLLLKEQSQLSELISSQRKQFEKKIYHLENLLNQRLLQLEEINDNRGLLTIESRKLMIKQKSLKQESAKLKKIILMLEIRNSKLKNQAKKSLPFFEHTNKNEESVEFIFTNKKTQEKDEDEDGSGSENDNENENEHNKKSKYHNLSNQLKSSGKRRNSRSRSNSLGSDTLSLIQIKEIGKARRKRSGSFDSTDRSIFHEKTKIKKKRDKKRKEKEKEKDKEKNDKKKKKSKNILKNTIKWKKRKNKNSSNLNQKKVKRSLTNPFGKK
ncbi:hypothetical protein M0812_19435 [Anaeramoeba flamelloides]|uniref:Shugoshin C-terminal domain-containing protein n=1 Tax=Anaeramoeba flamelloides TaxID=1746091 RepID=A0AAV7Z6F5_9EUKA|nr:hypothetical protein M0812_19435 [Anaeramoeba flamelloides]